MFRKCLCSKCLCSKCLCMLSVIMVILVVMGLLTSCNKADIKSSSAKAGSPSGTLISERKTSAKAATTIVTQTAANSSTKAVSTSDSTNDETQENELTDESDNSINIVDNNEPYEMTPYDFGGRKLTYYSITATYTDSFIEKYRNEGTTGGYLADALLDGFLKLESKYNFKFSMQAVSGGYFNTEYPAAVLAGVFDGDIVYMHPSLHWQLQKIENGQVIALDDYVDVLNHPYTKAISEGTLGFMKHKGHYYGWPMVPTGGPNLMLINDTIVEREGLTSVYDLYISNVWDWESFLNIAITTTRDLDGDGILDQFGIAGSLLDLFEGILRSNGITYVTKSDERFSFDLNTPEAIRTLQFAQNLFYTYRVVNAYSYFSSGNAAMSLNRTSNDSRILRSQGLTDTSFLPYPMGNDVFTYQSIHTGPYLYFVPSTVKEKERKAVVEIMMDAIGGCWGNPDNPLYFSVKKYYTKLNAGRLSDRDLELYADFTYQAHYDYNAVIPGLQTFLNDNVINPIMNGSSVGSVVDSTKAAGQSIIDSFIK